MPVWSAICRPLPAALYSGAAPGFQTHPVLFVTDAIPVVASERADGGRRKQQATTREEGGAREDGHAQFVWPRGIGGSDEQVSAFALPRLQLGIAPRLGFKGSDARSVGRRGTGTTETPGRSDAHSVCAKRFELALVDMSTPAIILGGMPQRPWRWK